MAGSGLLNSSAGPTGPTGPTGGAGPTGPTGPTGSAGGSATLTVAALTTNVNLPTSTNTTVLSVASVLPGTYLAVCNLALLSGITQSIFETAISSTGGSVTITGQKIGEVILVASSVGMVSMTAQIIVTGTTTIITQVFNNNAVNAGTCLFGTTGGAGNAPASGISLLKIA